MAPLVEEHSDRDDLSRRMRPVPWYAYGEESTAHFRGFLQHLLTSPPSPSILRDAFQKFPRHDCAIVVSWFLLVGGRQEREVVLDLFFEIAKSDKTVGAPAAYLWMLQVFDEMLSVAPEIERECWIEGVGRLLRQGSETFFKGVQFSLNESCHDTDHGYRKASGLIDVLLRSKLPHAYCTVLACAVSPIVSIKVKTHALTRLVEDPCPGTPALNQFLQRCLRECDPGECEIRLRLLAAAGGFLADYWGPLALWAFERPLRLAAARGQDLLKVYEDVCQKISPSTFLFAYNFADGDHNVLACLDRSLPAKDPSDDHLKWMSRQLKNALIRASFLSPFQQLQCQKSIVQIDSTNEEGRQLILNALGNASLQQREALPHMIAHRLIDFSDTIAKDQRSLESSFPSKFLSDIFSAQAQAFARIDPTLTAQEQVTALDVNCPDIQRWVEDVSWFSTYMGFGEDVDRRWFCATHTGPSSLRQFVRAHTIYNEQAPELLAALGEAFGQTIPTGELQRWIKWRYNPEDPQVARQLRSLTPVAREGWALASYCIFEGAAVGGAIAVPELQGRARYLVMEVDDPLWLFNLGMLPSISRACTAYNEGSYYSKAAVSYVLDAHIKGLIVLDYTKVLKDLAPEMPQAYREMIETEALSNEVFRACFYELATAVVARSVLKLVEDCDGNPLLMMEPTFVNGLLRKDDPTPELLTFAQALALKYRAGICVAPYANEFTFPMTAVVIPPSRSPGGQLENHDLMPWMGSHHGGTKVNAILLIPPPQQHRDHHFWKGLV